MHRICVSILAAAGLVGIARADLVPFERSENFSGTSGSAQSLPAAASDVTLTFTTWTYRDGDRYGSGPCFPRTFSSENGVLLAVGCPQSYGCGWNSGTTVVDAATFNAWRSDGGVQFAMSWQNSACGLAWSVRMQYLIDGVDRTDHFTGEQGVSTGLLPAEDDVLIEFRSSTYRPYNEYGSSPCFGRSLLLEGDVEIALACPGFGCQEAVASVQVPAATFNGWIEDGLDLSMSWQSSNCGLSWSVRYLYEDVPDCNGNSRADDVDIAIGTSPDCNADGLPDECQGVERVKFEGPVASPFGAGNPSVATFEGLPPALALVEIRFEARADLDSASEVVIPVLDGVQYPPLFISDGDACSGTSTGTLLLTPEVFTELTMDGSLVVQAIASAPVNPFECGETSMGVSLRYVAFTETADCDSDGEIDVCSKGGIGADCNQNGIGDLCDIASGFDFDCDGDGIADSCQILDQPDLDKNWNFVLDACEVLRGDLDLDGEVGPSDLAVLLSLWGLGGAFVPDLDGDGLVGPGDLAILLANWQTSLVPPCGNGRPNAFEDCETCPEDVSCGPGTTCVLGACVPCPPPPYGGYGCGYGAMTSSFDGYRHREDLGLDPNFRHFSRIPVEALGIAAAAVSLLALGFARLR